MIGRRMRSKGGGPTLVVQELVSDEVVSCTWMNAMGKHKTETFSLSGLEDLDRPADHTQALGRGDHPPDRDQPLSHPA